MYLKVKKYILLIVVVFITTSLYAQNDNSKIGWAYYSLGLNYRNLAFEKTDAQEQIALLNQALSHFLKAAEDEEALDVIYTQIADTYLIVNNTELAISYALKAIEYNMAYTEAYFKLYEAYMRRRDFKSAGETLENYRKINPSDMLTLYTLGEHYYKYLSDTKASRNAFESLLSLNQNVVGNEAYREFANYYLGYIAYIENRYPDSMKHFENALSVNPNNARARYMLMLLYYEACRFSEAKTQAIMYLESTGSDPIASSVIGRVRYIERMGGYVSHLRRGAQPRRQTDSTTQKSLENFISEGLLMAINREDEALIFLTKLIEAKTNDISVRIALSNILKEDGDKRGACLELVAGGMIAFDAGNFDLAGRLFREALVLDDTIPEIYYYLGAVAEEKDLIATALFYYKKLYSVKPSEDLAIHIGYLHILRKQYNRALPYFRLVLADNPNNARAHFMMGLLHYEQDKYKDADKAFLKAIELDSENEIHYLYLAQVREKAKNMEGMLEILELAYKLFPESPDVNNFLGYIYVDYSIDLDKGYKLIQKALSIDPANHAYIDSLGWFYYRKGDYQKALEKLLLAGSGSVKDPVIFDHLGDTYLKLGDKKQALDNWKKSLELEKNAEIQKKIDEVLLDKDDKK